MKSKVISTRFKWLATLTIAMVAIGGLAISPAFGGPGFLTPKKAAKLFFTKKQARRLFLTKSGGEGLLASASADAAKQVAAAKTQADSSYLSRSGSIQIQVSPDNWIATNSTDVVDHSSGAAGLETTGAFSDRFFNAALTLPSILQGRPVSVESFELCYSATSVNATIDRVFLFTRAPTAADVSPSGETPINDETNRDDATCRTYAGASPVPLGPNTLAQVVMRNDYSAAGSITVSRLTINLST